MPNTCSFVVHLKQYKKLCSSFLFVRDSLIFHSGVQQFPVPTAGQWCDEAQLSATVPAKHEPQGHSSVSSARLGRATSSPSQPPLMPGVAKIPSTPSNRLLSFGEGSQIHLRKNSAGVEVDLKVSLTRL